MFQGMKVGYNKKEDRFTGTGVLPDKVLDTALSELKALVDSKKPNPMGKTEWHDGYVSALSDIASLFNGKE